MLPLVVAAPLLGLFMNMEPAGIGATALTLLVGTPAIAFIGAAGAAVAVGLPRGGVLVSVLVLPLAIPVLIFGVSASYAAVNEPDPFLPPFLILAALTLFLAVIGPVAAALALRYSADEHDRQGDSQVACNAACGVRRDCGRTWPAYIQPGERRQNNDRTCALCDSRLRHIGAGDRRR